MHGCSLTGNLLRLLYHVVKFLGYMQSDRISFLKGVSTSPCNGSVSFENKIKRGIAGLDTRDTSSLRVYRCCLLFCLGWGGGRNQRSAHGRTKGHRRARHAGELHGGCDEVWRRPKHAGVGRSPGAEEHRGQCAKIKDAERDRAHVCVCVCIHVFINFLYNPRMCACSSH